MDGNGTNQDWESKLGMFFEPPCFGSLLNNEPIEALGMGKIGRTENVAQISLSLL
jgi:hypothetical protein